MSEMSTPLSELSELNRVLLVGGNNCVARRLTELVNAGAAVTVIVSSNEMTSSALDAISKNKETRQIDYIERDINVEYDIRASLSYNLIVICMTSDSQARYVSLILLIHAETFHWLPKKKE
jgi:siroheme synthase (precorrin-2 oxidase/ferrochelatase)